MKYQEKIHNKKSNLYNIMNNELSETIGNGTTIEDIRKNIIKKNKLASSIEHKMDEYDTDTDSTSSTESLKKRKKKSKKKHKKISFKLPEWTHDPLIILCLYVLLSTDVIRIFISKYIKIISPDENGNVGIIGNIIFGIILASLFTIIKKFF